jgi:23S rRNA pseudouridine1911/1915/1917 synthase
MSNHELPYEPIQLVVSEADAGCRVDWFLARRFPQFSRVFMRKVVNSEAVRVDGKRVKGSLRLKAGQRVTIVLPELPRQGPQPENIPLEVLFEDEHLVAINKPPGMVVHPAKGHWSGTLTAALQYHFNSLSSVGGPSRPGVVHRLDRDTTGVIVVAKTDQAHFRLAEQFENRDLLKEYTAIVLGSLERDRDVIDLPIGPHPYQREKMAIRRDELVGRPARTFYEVVERFAGLTLLRVLPKTGRTHQIRVHLAAVGAPVLCDRLYGGRARITLHEIARRRMADPDRVLLERQALHAARIVFSHPITGTQIDISAPLPGDMQEVLEALQQYRRK